ncbi:uncharacterized protein J3R85_006533 [Psidium guajava]|nr:uncharacterized protein J3R85_006533 [Psidium guajava]
MFSYSEIKVFHCKRVLSFRRDIPELEVILLDLLVCCGDTCGSSSFYCLLAFHMIRLIPKHSPNLC